VKDKTITYKQQDVTGVQEFGYGNMGELIFNLHSYVALNSSDAFSLTTNWDYDSWNRVKTIIYPDGESLTYNYNMGGLLKSIKGDKNGNIYDYIKEIDYDEYEQRTDVYNGNNTSSHYTYDPVMRRMTTLTTINPNGNILDINYDYDSVGNITTIDNVGINKYHQEYIYNDLYQLKVATGNWNNNQINYNLEMTYSPSGKITNKTLYGKSIDNSGTHAMDHRTDYNYTNSNNPYGVMYTYDNINSIQNDFDWDVKGNMIFNKSPQWGSRYLCWTEDNRLQAVKDDKMAAFYNYDASGERNLKLTGENVDVIQNGQLVNISILDQQTLYASALVTINDKGYTKHYFEEGKRICSKIGSGYLQDISTLSPPIEGDYKDIQETRLQGGITETFGKCMGQEVAIKTQDLLTNIIKNTNIK